MPYQMATTEAGLADVDTQIENDPKSRYSPGGERVLTLAGTAAYRGYPKVTWEWEVLSLTDWGTLKTVLGGGYLSAETYIQTRTDADVWANYRAIARLPDPASMTRWGNHYQNVVVEFSLLETL